MHLVYALFTDITDRIYCDNISAQIKHLILLPSPCLTVNMSTLVCSVLYL